MKQRLVTACVVYFGLWLIGLMCLYLMGTFGTAEGPYTPQPGWYDGRLADSAEHRSETQMGDFAPSETTVRD